MGIQFGRKKKTPHRHLLSAIRKGGGGLRFKKGGGEKRVWFRCDARETKENLFSEIVSVMM